MCKSDFSNCLLIRYHWSTVKGLIWLHVLHDLTKFYGHFSWLIFLVYTYWKIQIRINFLFNHPLLHFVVNLYVFYVIKCTAFWGPTSTGGLVQRGPGTSTRRWPRAQGLSGQTWGWWVWGQLLRRKGLTSHLGQPGSWGQRLSCS